MGDSAESGSTCVVTELFVTVKDEMHDAENTQQKCNDKRKEMMQ